VKEPYKQPVAAAVLLYGRLDLQTTYCCCCAALWQAASGALRWYLVLQVPIAMQDWYTGYLGTNRLGTSGDIELVSWVPDTRETALVNSQPNTRNWYPLYTKIGYPMSAKARGARIYDSA